MKDNKKIDQRFLVSLDMLLDTTLATLFTINPKFPSQALENGYRSRQLRSPVSLIPNLTREVWDKAWKERGYDALRNSTPTHYLTKLIADTHRMVAEKETNPFVEDVKIIINFYPYRMEPEVQNEIIDTIKDHVHEDVQVSGVFRSTAEMTPQWIRHHCEAFTILDFNEWLGYHENVLQDFPMPSVICFTPSFFVAQPKAGLEIDPLTAVTVALADYLSVEWMPVASATPAV